MKNPDKITWKLWNTGKNQKDVPNDRFGEQAQSSYIRFPEHGRLSIKTAKSDRQYSKTDCLTLCHSEIAKLYKNNLKIDGIKYSNGYNAGYRRIQNGFGEQPLKSSWKSEQLDQHNCRKGCPGYMTFVDTWCWRCDIVNVCHALWAGFGIVLQVEFY